MPSMGVAGQLNSSRDSVRSRSAHTIDREELHQSTTVDFVPPEVIEEQLRQDEHLGQDVKPWLMSFGELKPGTSVSLRFKTDESDVPHEKPHSLLPLLTIWVRTWFERSNSKSTGEPQDRNSLTWLFQFIADYVELGHSRLDHEEVHDLCLELLEVCLKARHQAHLEGCLSVLLSVTRVGEFPKACLKDVLITLSQANVILDKPLTRAGDIVELLATGSLQNETIAELFSALLTVAQTQKFPQSQPDFDLAKHLNSARGAVRYLSSLLEICGPNEKFVIDLKESLTVLNDTAKSHLLRLATEILDLLSTLLSSSRIDELVSNETYITTLLDIYDLCKEASIIPDSSDNTLTKSKSPSQDQVNRERRYKRDHDLALSRFRENLTSILPLMDDSNAARIWKEFRNLIHLQPAKKRANAIEYLKYQELCLPGRNPTWSEDLHLLIEKIIIADTTEANAFTEQQAWDHKQDTTTTLEAEIAKRTQQRIDVMRLCAKAIHQAASYKAYNGTAASEEPVAAEVGVQELEIMLGVFNMETDMRVIEALLDEAIKLCASTTASESQPYAAIIIKAIGEGILQHSRNAHEAEVVYLAGTEALRSIFLQGLAHMTTTTSQAYSALLRIADFTSCKSLRCRLAAMSVLSRLRCDTAGLIYIDDASESTYIANAVCKTGESLGAILSQSMDNLNEEEKAALSTKHREIYQRQLWMYPDEEDSFKRWIIPEDLKTFVNYSEEASPSDRSLDISKWVFVVTSNLQQDKDWETYSYVLVHLGAQLTNTNLFENSQDLIHQLRGFLCGRVRDIDKIFVPPQDVGLEKSDVALCFYHILARMIPFYKMQTSTSKYEGVDNGRRGVDLVRAFKEGFSKRYEGTSRTCVHALSICCFEMPEAIASEYPGIIEAMSQSIFKPHLLVHILEFLAQVARLPHLHSNFRELEVKQVLYICIRALQTIRQKDEVRTYAIHEVRRGNAHTRRAPLLTPYRAARLKEKGLPQYSCALAYHTMIFWFLSIPLGRREKYIEEVIEQLTWKDSSGKDIIDEQTIVMIDMMQRSAYSDLPETSRDESFTGENIKKAIYVVGNSIYEIETNNTNGLSQLTKRQASGTTYAIFKPNIQKLPVHQDTSFDEQVEARGFYDKVTPSHTLLNFIASAEPIQLQEQPLKLNLQEDYVTRAIRLIDNKPTVDSHKIGVILLKDGQTQETEYLVNTSGTENFDEFLNSLGTRVSLEQPCPFISWGLVHGEDGTETIAWRDRINEIVYEVSTLMPNADDTYQSRKKSHIGNCHVLIVFNQSNKPWKWEGFASQVTAVQIVITPANRVSSKKSSDNFYHEDYQVEVLTKEDYQNISAAAETKVVSQTTLAPFIRMLALNANIFSECARNTSTGDAEFPSSWRYRLQAILQLKERTQQRVLDNEDSTAKRYDFSRYT